MTRVYTGPLLTAVIHNWISSPRIKMFIYLFFMIIVFHFVLSCFTVIMTSLHDSSFSSIFSRLHCKDNGQQMLRFSILVRRRKTIHLCFVFIWEEVVCDNIWLRWRWRMGTVLRFVSVTINFHPQESAAELWSGRDEVKRAVKLARRN